MASNNNHNNNNNNNPTNGPNSTSSHLGPSGRSPFPTGRRTRLVRPSLESTTTADDSAHSPFLQGLLRFSPNNNTTVVNHWSPRASARSFFGGSSFSNMATGSDHNSNNANSNHNNNSLNETADASTKPTDESSSMMIPSYTTAAPRAVVDGLPLESLRALARQQLLQSSSSASSSNNTFYASLVYSKTGHPDDALLLARLHAQAHNTSACLKVLEESQLLQSPNPWEALLVACVALAAQEEWPSLVELLEDACRLPDDSNQNTPHPTTTTTSSSILARPLDDHDDFAWHALLDAIGRQPSDEIHVLARICTWRGRAYLETGHGIRAAVYWKRALQMDCRCQQAWEFLLERHLVTSGEAYELLQSLEFGSDWQWLKALYLARIDAAPQAHSATTSTDNDNKVALSSTALFSPNASAIPFSSPTFSTPAPAGKVDLHHHHHTFDNNNTDKEAASDMQKAIDEALDLLWDEHKLQNSPHVLAMAARRAYRRYQWKEALEYGEKLALLDPNVTGAAFCYISSLVLLGHKRVLFRRAHEWVEFAPKAAQSWFAVGAYYYSCQRYHVAQRHFCRATRLDPQCTEAWVAFGCAFAACDESDQALASFRAAQRLSPGEHTALLYMGMEYVRTNHLVLAQHFLNSALSSSGGGDPLCLHELGVLHAQKGEPDQAIVWLERALASIRQSDDGDSSFDAIQDPYWEPTVFALGHCYRKTRQYNKAALCYRHAIALCPDKHSTYAALAFCKHLVRDLDEAIPLYHQALSLKADDPFGSEMLQRALQEHASLSLLETKPASHDPPATPSDILATPRRDDSAMMMSMDVDESLDM